MASSGTLVVRLLADDKDLQKGLDGAGKQVTKTGEKFASAGKKMTMFATVPIVAAMGATVKMASDLEQSMGAVDSVFGESRKVIDDFADTAAESAGLSKREVNEMAAVIGASLKGMGFETDEAATKVVELEKRAADMAATFGGSTQDAIQAIASLMRGERDPIEKYGVSIKAVDVNARLAAQGQDKLTGSAAKQAEAMAGLDLLMEQTTDTQGAFAREADTTAGATARAKAEMENAAATLGQKLLPIASKAAGGVAGIASAFGSLPDAAQNGILAVGGVVAVSGPILTVVGSLQKLKAAIQAIQWANVAMAATGPLAALTIATTGATAGFILLNKVADAFRKADADLDASIAGTVNHLALLRTGTTESADALRDNAVAAYMAGSAQRGFTSDLDEVSEAGQVVSEQVKRAIPVLESLTEQTGVTSERIAQLATEMGINLADASDTQREKLAAAVSEIGRAVTPTERLEDVQENLGNEFATTAEEVDGFKEALDAALGVFLTAEEATIRLRQKTDELAEAINKGKEEDETAAEFKDRLALETIGVVEATQQEIDALVNSGQVSSETAAQQAALRDRLVELRDRFPELRGQIDSYIGRLDAIPTTTNTTVRVSTGAALAAIDQLADRLSRVPRRVAIEMVVDAVQRDQQLANRFAPSRHAGGVYRAPTPGGEGLALLRDGETVTTPEAPQGGWPDPNEWGRVAARAMGREMVQIVRSS